MPQPTTTLLWRALEDGTGNFPLIEGRPARRLMSFQKNLLKKKIYSDINDIAGCMPRL